MDTSARSEKQIEHETQEKSCPMQQNDPFAYFENTLNFVTLCFDLSIKTVEDSEFENTITDEP